MPDIPCALYSAHYPRPENLSWVLYIATPIAALMAFTIGANDSANSWGTSVGSGAIKLRYAVLLGTEFANFIVMTMRQSLVWLY